MTETTVPIDTAPPFDPNVDMCAACHGVGVVRIEGGEQLKLCGCAASATARIVGGSFFERVAPRSSGEMAMDALAKPFVEMIGDRTDLRVIEVMLDVDGIDKENRAASAAATVVYSVPARVGHALQDLRREKSEHALTRQSLAAVLKERDQLLAGPLGKAWGELRGERDRLADALRHEGVDPVSLLRMAS